MTTIKRCEQCGAPATWAVNVFTTASGPRPSADTTACSEHVNSVVDRWTADGWIPRDVITTRVEVDRIAR